MNTVVRRFLKRSDWSIFHTLDEVKSGFMKDAETEFMQVKEISPNDGSVENRRKTGNIEHCRESFFECMDCVSLQNHERMSGWDQPILQQIDYDGGIVGLIRKRFSGIPHYLCEAKRSQGIMEWFR